MSRPPRVIVGAKLPLRPMHARTIRVRLQIAKRVRDLARFDIALDSKLRGCDVVCLRVADIVAGQSRRSLGGLTASEAWKARRSKANTSSATKSPPILKSVLT